MPEFFESKLAWRVNWLSLAQLFCFQMLAFCEEEVVRTLRKACHQAASQSWFYFDLLKFLNGKMSTSILVLHGHIVVIDMQAPTNSS
jgi:hypothetical protein